MTGAAFSYALLAALATALLVAAVTDWRSRTIANTLNLAIALAAPLWWLATDLPLSAIGWQLALAAGTFAVAALLFAAGQMGGGDVKLLTALALWFAPASFFQLFVLMAILGGGGSLAMALFNMQRDREARTADTLAMLATVLAIGCLTAMAIATATHGPLIPPAAIVFVANTMPNIWLIFAALLVLVVLLTWGLRRVMRRQKSRIEVPYGIAIAAAALWVIGTEMLATITA
ncbi:A24 family peptidase [Novosphingobium sp. Leaf2]|uniref:A24 family peptidase n=1 Tax=Novosphingobium sp. Leaf2 TaxID=1735670 RepID=UPI0006F3EE7B|nr:prepilin peptidase [Novosphingobium sp. Leaf2]KQM20622.1 potassium:proton antiporter [Novosphingobium sp. Leaf2]